jgi:raffinose/stachyose/melibiose transport system permease protein
MSDKSLKRGSYTILAGPAVLIYASVVVLPVLFSFVVGFFRWNGFEPPQFVGLANYAHIFTDPFFWHDVRNNLLIVAVSLFGQLPIGFVLAYILYRRMVRNGPFFETMIFLPITISAIVVAILWNRLFSPEGVLVDIMRHLTGDHRWVLSIQEDKYWAIFPVLFVILWQFTGLYMVIFLANMQKIQKSTIEAALLDGASEWQILRKVIVPNLVGIISTCVIYAIAGSLKTFDLIWAMTAGGPARYTEVLSIYMYDNTFHYAVNPFGLGSASSVAIILLSVVLIITTQKIFRIFERKYE